MADADRLDSWKEIATYLGRSVRTAKRWEHDEGLPVRRHQHRALGSVYAYKRELDGWREAHERTTVLRIPAPHETGLRSIAILPFISLGADRENESFADGLTEEIATRLGRVHALRVIAGTSSRRFRDRTTTSARSIASQLSVQYLVDGTVRRVGDHLRITARLIDGRSEEQLWAEAYDGSLRDVFDIQERLAGMIVDALQLRLTTGEREALRERPIDNLPAYECYLRARGETWRWRKDAIDKAVRLLNGALEIIGPNPRLYAALGLAHLQYREAGIELGEAPLAEAERCAERLFALDPESGPGYQLRGWISYARGRIQEAVADLGHALRAEPNHPDTLLLITNCYLISGRVAEARPLLARLLAIDPLTPITRCMPAFADILEGRPAAAVGAYRQMYEMDPFNPMARLFYAWALLLNGCVEDASAVVSGYPAESRGTVAARVAEFLVSAASNTHAAREAAVTPEVEDAAKSSDVFARFLAEAYAMAGATEPALRWLQTAVSRGFINYEFLAFHDPFFGPLRGDERFVLLLREVHARWSSFRIR